MTLSALGVVAAAITLGASGMFLLLGRSLSASLRQSAAVQADAVAALAGQGVLPASLPGRSSLVQVLGPSGTVLVSNRAAAGDGPLAPPARPGTMSVVETPHLAVRSRADGRAGQGRNEGPWFVARKAVLSPRGEMTAVVATSADTLGEFLSRLALLLIVGLPALLALGGVTAWVLAGRALAPVEKIRVEVATLSEGGLQRRITEPVAQDEIGRLARTMNSMLDRLEAYALRQRDFASDASHELRTPIAAIRAQLEVALAHPESDWPAVAAEVLEEVYLMGRIVEDLLSLARGESPSASEKGRPVDLDELVLAEARRLRERCALARRPLSIDASRVSAGRVIGHADQLRRMVRNLCDNAALHAASEVHLSLSSGGGVVELSVSDDGPGIPAGEEERIFERFTRLDEGRSRDAGGAGLGLAMVRDIVSRHGGEVFVSGASPGATFVVRLPMAG